MKLAHTLARPEPLVTVFAALTCVLAAGPDARAQEPEAPPAAQAAEGELSNRELFADFLHNAVLGKFQRADAFANRLLANNPDPAEILEYADAHTNSLKTLILLVNNIEVSDSAKRVLDLIHEGELLRRQDPRRIKENIAKLGGDPQTEFYAINRLKDSGEYAVPWLILTLQDRSKSRLRSRIIRMLPRLGKEAVNPLVIALSMNDNETKQFVVQVLGEIGYPQAIPYLSAVLADQNTFPELKSHVEQAILKISSGSPGVTVGTASEAFVGLADQYYSDHGSVKADERFDFANVWYWWEDHLERIEVPREIFNEIMAMRCCEDALRLDPQRDQAIGLWLAANIRREAELGLDVESPAPDPDAQADPTKAQDFPRSAYFARAAGARYCHMVVDLAMQHNEPAVALGAIAALRLVAGATNLIGTEDFKQPLAAALTFPDQVVRMRAALALGHALPTQSFAGSDRVVPALTDALAQTGVQELLVIDPEEQNLNRVMDALRGDASMVIGEAQLYDVLERARHETSSVGGIFLASDVTDPALSGAVNTLRSNNLYALTPIVILTKQGTAEEAEQLARADAAVVSVVAGASADEIRRAWRQLSMARGQNQLAPDAALALALDAADALRNIAFSNSAIYDFGLAEGALIEALGSEHESLQISAASVLALSKTSRAQEAIATVALDPNHTESLRIAAFGSLAESAKVNGNMLSENLQDLLIDLAINDPNLTLRSAGSQALGALNLPSNKAGQIIEKFYRG